MVYPTEVAVDPGLPPGLQGRPVGRMGSGSAEFAPAQGKLQQDLLEIEKATAKVRGLEPLHDVEEHLIDKNQLHQNMLGLRDKSYTREDARQSELQLWLLRLIKEPSIGLYQLQADMLSSEIAGYYDHETKQLYVLAGSDTLDAAEKTTLSHEYVHSLQDQHFGLSNIIPRNSNDSDRLLASKSLVEGDASLSSLLYADEYLSVKEFKNLVQDSLSYNAPASSVPGIFEETLHFPYNQGAAFVQTLYTRGGFETIDKAFADPPKSTEQIMHPEKYLSAQRDDPLPVGVPPLTATLGAGWTYRMTENIGEFELGILLKDNGVKKPADAVAGWGGGQVDLYEKDADSLVILGTIWDTEKDAHEFSAALLQSLSLMGRSGPYWSDTLRYMAVKSFRDKVFYVASTNPDAVGRALAAIK